MLWRLSLAVAVVCVSGMYGCARADLMSRLIIPRDYGVKLCGREFIRAVIFTCGGSRWRRSTEGELDPFQLKSFSDVSVEESRQTWQPSTDLTADNLSPLHLSSSHSLADLVALFGDQRHSLRASETQEKPWSSTILGEADLPILSKRKRNFSLGVAGKCCNQGCTKNDIGRLC